MALLLREKSRENSWLSNSLKVKQSDQEDTVSPRPQDWRVQSASIQGRRVQSPESQVTTEPREEKSN